MSRQINEKLALSDAIVNKIRFYLKNIKGKENRR